MRPLIPIALLTCCLGACGCASGRGNTSALEAELRQQEDRIVRLQTELRHVSDDLAATRREADSFRAQATAVGQVALVAEQAEVLFRAEGLRINTLLTGGIDEDNVPGDEVLHLVLEPTDADGNTVKLPGEVMVEITDPAADGAARQVGAWTFPADQVRLAWQSGLFVTGFKFRLPWNVPPSHGRLIVHARLSTADGRRFDATETVQVKPPAPPAEGTPPAPLPETAAPPTMVPTPPTIPPPGTDDIEWINGVE